MSSSSGSNAPELFEVLCGMPRCRDLRHTGAAYECRPHLPSASTTRVIPWMWFWQIRWNATRLFRLLALGEILVSCILFAEVLHLSNVQWAIVFLLLFNFVFTLPMLYMAHMSLFNYKLREALSMCLGKAAQAKAQWANARNPELAKWPFYEHPVTPNFKLVVLTDGSREVWNTTGDELSPRLKAALCLSGFNGSHFVLKTSSNSDLLRSHELPSERVSLVPLLNMSPDIV